MYVHTPKDSKFVLLAIFSFSALFAVFVPPLLLPVIKVL
jgi:hypothetical protein